MRSRWSFLMLSCAAAAAIAVAVPASVAAQGRGESAREITVSGTGTAYGAPDVAIVQLGVESRAPEVQGALSDAAAKMGAILSALQDAGVDKSDITTSEYSVNFVPPAPQAEVQGGSSGGARPGYYEVVDMASVTIRAIDKVGRILDAATRAGANRIDGIRFEISNPWAEEARALDKAYAQAHERAQRLAALAKVSLGPVQRATEGGFTRPESAPVFRAEAMVAPPVSAGSLGVTVTVSVVYSIE